MRAVLGLDCGTRTGWALWDGQRVESGVMDFSLKRGESPGMRFLAFNRWLGGVLLALPATTLVVYELAHHRGGAATAVGVGLMTRVEEACAHHGYAYAGVHTATLKKFATGKGNSPKPAMLAAARTALGYAGADDNEADALWLLAYGRQELAA